MKLFGNSRRKMTVGSMITQILLLVWVVVTLYPTVWVLISSLKSNGEILGSPFTLPATPQFQNYLSAWTSFGDKATLGTFIVNSLIVSVISIVLILMVSLTSAYALARYRFGGRVVMNILLSLAIAIPSQGIIVPLFLQMSKFGLTNSHFGLALVHAVTQCAMPTMILTSFFRSLPVSVEEAALLDGCTELGKFVRIVLPLSVPSIVTVIIITFVGVWNDLLFSLIFLTKTDMKTLTQALTYFVNEGGVDYGRTFAAVSISIIPVIIIFLLLQKRIIAAMASGAEKG